MNIDTTTKISIICDQTLKKWLKSYCVKYDITMTNLIIDYIKYLKHKEKT
jgi:hypothetical protein